MKQPSVYLKMRVLGAIDTVPGRTRHERIANVAAMTFLDEDGNPVSRALRAAQKRALGRATAAAVDRAMRHIL